MVKVSINPNTEHKGLAEVYAKLLKEWKATGILPSRFGRDGMWEANARTKDSQIFKIHIRLPEEAPWKKHKPQIDRCSNHYLVYARHWLYDDNYQIISIMTPNAHEMARTSFLGELERRAEHFQNSNP